jgi:hypothetical protein
MKGNKIIIAIALALIAVSAVSATSVNRNSLTVEGYPGDTIRAEIMLTGTLPDQTGHWEVTYKQVEGEDANDEKLDITSWITITPVEYRIKQGETKTFTVEIAIPKGVQPGLYGATSIDAGQPGHFDERRTYILFGDANTTAVIEGGGSVAYSGVRVPVIVSVLGKPNPLIPIITAIQANIVSIALLAIVIVLLVLLLRRKK